jgi:hypothetical protein
MAVTQDERESALFDFRIICWRYLFIVFGARVLRERYLAF